MPRKLSIDEIHARTVARCQKGILDAAPTLCRIAHGEPPRPGCPTPTPRDVLRALRMILRLRDDTEKQIQKAAQARTVADELRARRKELARVEAELAARQSAPSPDPGEVRAEIDTFLSAAGRYGTGGDGGGPASFRSQ